MKKKRHTTWRAKHLSIGRRVTLINSVLRNIPLYFLSLYKAPKKVLHSLTSIQQNCLWGGCSEDMKNVLGWLGQHVQEDKNRGLGVKF